MVTLRKDWIATPNVDPSKTCLPSERSWNRVVLDTQIPPEWLCGAKFPHNQRIRADPRATETAVAGMIERAAPLPHATPGSLGQAAASPQLPQPHGRILVAR